MTKYLAAIIGEEEKQFARRIELLEKTTLQTGVDIRLSTQIRYQTAQKMKELGLDPYDTTPEELYSALHSKAKQDEEVLKDYLGIKQGTDSVAILQKVAKHYATLAQKQRLWAIKKSTLKKIFTELPPNKTMKVIKYRSIQSLLKRESVTELYALVDLLESESYKQKLTQRLKRLTNADLEETALQVLCLSKVRWQHVQAHTKKTTAPVVLHAEVASILVIPVHVANVTCLALLASTLVLKKIQESKVKAAYIKIKTLDPRFYQHVHAVASSEHVPLFMVQQEQVMWSHVYKMHSRTQLQAEQYGPHVTAEDLDWFHIEDALLPVGPSFSFWVGTHGLAYVSAEGQVVSLHLADVAFSCMFAQPVQQASVLFVRAAVNDELTELYLELPPFSRMLQEFMYKFTDTEQDVVYA
jgi:hypothetical protein